MTSKQQGDVDRRQADKVAEDLNDHLVECGKRFTELATTVNNQKDTLVKIESAVVKISDKLDAHIKDVDKRIDSEYKSIINMILQGAGWIIGALIVGLATTVWYNITK